MGEQFDVLKKKVPFRRLISESLLTLYVVRVNEYAHRVQNDLYTQCLLIFGTYRSMGHFYKCGFLTHRDNRGVVRFSSEQN